MPLGVFLHSKTSIMNLQTNMMLHILRNSNMAWPIRTSRISLLTPNYDRAKHGQARGHTRSMQHPKTVQDSDNDVVVLRVTPRARPPTRAFPINVPTLDEMDDQLPVGVMQNGQAVVKQDVDQRFWHLSRIHPSGNPACNASMTGRGAPRSLCKTKIKVSGRTVRGVATIAPSFVGFSFPSSRNKALQEEDVAIWRMLEKTAAGKDNNNDVNRKLVGVRR
ncbi:hypothetical protein R1sor_019481 [Riccia sorocarpa]|uniref:Uncharacterized protein n=1 Tax=Riccia sorocarpa TaxID=122646 RepID=A0ABD3IFX7_9MARC